MSSKKNLKFEFLLNPKVFILFIFLFGDLALYSQSSFAETQRDNSLITYLNFSKKSCILPKEYFEIKSDTLQFRSSLNLSAFYVPENALQETTEPICNFILDNYIALEIKQRKLSKQEILKYDNDVRKTSEVFYYGDIILNNSNHDKKIRVFIIKDSSGIKTVLCLTSNNNFLLSVVTLSKHFSCIYGGINIECNMSYEGVFTSTQVYNNHGLTHSFYRGFRKLTKNWHSLVYTKYKINLKSGKIKTLYSSFE